MQKDNTFFSVVSLDTTLDAHLVWCHSINKEIDNMPKPVIRIQTRYQPDLHQWLADRAKQNTRSLNGELMEILKKMKEGEEQKAVFDRANNP